MQNLKRMGYQNRRSADLLVNRGFTYPILIVLGLILVFAAQHMSNSSLLKLLLP